eukprot:CAMPEP_0197579672 /NCGR_PEP_ID=MMETSP1326-20131121/3627_1 /TAXON_ID=1155430 /ORGANISM="Genus nov. species nov., Strain RCC2288" /LENGTH=93 /DNA_ID=CAMNT_0043143209 /DNA_START=294 /DNA_END=575 /DNA_ORIENTATION=-
MSWIYGASGGTNFWEEQIKKERSLKKNWADKYGVELSTKKAEEFAAMQAEEVAAEAAAAKAAKLSTRPKLGKVSDTWRTKCGPTGVTMVPSRK